MKLLKSLGATALMLSASFSAQTTWADKLVISNWDGYMPADMVERFKKETGIDAEVALHATNEEIMGKVVASKGKGYDVLFVSSPFVEVLNKLDLIAKLDHKLIPNTKNLYSQANELNYDKGNKVSMPYAWGTTGLCYRADLMDEPTSWNDLLKPNDALKGKVTMLSTDRWLMAAGFLSLGYSVNSTNPSEIAEAKQVLKSAKKSILAYDDATFYAKLVSGEATMTHAWDGWCNYGTAENPNIKYVIPKEGTDMYVDSMVITKNSKMKKEAHAFINYVLSKEIGVWIVNNVMYKTPNEAAMSSIDPAMMKAYPNLAMSPDEILKQEQLRDLGKTQKAYTKAVTEILASN
ncbi:MAG: spermidine/putrescine ABC transporter substrate-binding protein [Gammaproteobacteria bacterium]|nr:spermidine/putrescine ABC transporter substrate-binding protein [Gammaproteobacteria bacterium]